MVHAHGRVAIHDDERYVGAPEALKARGERTIADSMLATLGPAA